MAARVHAPPGTYSSGQAELATVRGGKQAVVAMQDDGTLIVVTWLENGVEMAVRGPTLTKEQALDAIEKL